MTIRKREALLRHQPFAGDVAGVAGTISSKRPRLRWPNSEELVSKQLFSSCHKPSTELESGVPVRAQRYLLFSSQQTIVPETVSIVFCT